MNHYAEWNLVSKYQSHRSFLIKFRANSDWSINLEIPAMTVPWNRMVATCNSLAGNYTLTLYLNNAGSHIQDSISLYFEGFSFL